MQSRGFRRLSGSNESRSVGAVHNHGQSVFEHGNDSAALPDDGTGCGRDSAVKERKVFRNMPRGLLTQTDEGEAVSIVVGDALPEFRPRIAGASDGEEHWLFPASCAA